MKFSVENAIRSSENISLKRPPGQQLQVKSYPAYEVTLDNNSDSPVKVEDLLLLFDSLCVKFPGNIKSGQILQPWEVAKSSPQMAELLKDRFRDFHPQTEFSLVEATVVLKYSGGTLTENFPQ